MNDKDKKLQDKLRFAGEKVPSMKWRSNTIWECELKPKLREQTLESLAFTLNYILLQDHSVKKSLPLTGCSFPEEESSMAAEPT